MPPAPDHRAALDTPAWMRVALKLAGAYNLLWGAAAVLFPLATFRLAGFDPLPNYPEIWQCVGMIVGVYGVGYWVAASDPVRHWPIVLVGLLGKILGPIGFAWSVAKGTFPASMGWTILTNDLIWWVPFGLILFHAARAEQTAAMLSADRGEPTTPGGRTLDEVVAEGRHLVVFLRHAGCTFCREALADLSARRRWLEDAGVEPVFVHMGRDADAALAMFDGYGLGDCPSIADPGGVLYRRYGLGLGGVRQLFGPEVWLRGFDAAVVRQHWVGTLAGNGFQMPGAFAVEDGRVVGEFRAARASDRPDYVQLATSAPHGAGLGGATA